MKYYTYDEDWVFTGSKEYNNIRPAKSTFIAPPDNKKGNWLFTGDTWVPYIKEDVVEVPVRVIPTSDFLNRFIEDTLDGILNSPASFIKTFVLKIQVSTEVDLDSESLIASLDKLEQTNLITAEEIAVLLA